MKIVIYGAGNAREVATYKHLAAFPNECEVKLLFYTEKSPCQIFQNSHYVASIQDAIRVCREMKPNYVFVLSPQDLFEGAADAFKGAGFNVFGVSKYVAQLEESKVYSKGFMDRYNIPTPKSIFISSEAAAVQYLQTHWSDASTRFVLKGDGFLLNAYDRVATPETLVEAYSEIKRIFAQNGRKGILIEERIDGYELSLHLLVDRERYYIFPAVQDYKRLYPDNKGPMTHGIASVSTSSPYPPKLLSEIEEKIIKPTLQGFITEGIDYKSILYIGLMVTKSGVKVLEFNVRSGNPEWIAILGLLKGSLIKLLTLFRENAPQTKLDDLWVKQRTSVAVFGLSHDYPTHVGLNQDEDVTGLNLLDNDIMPEALRLDHKTITSIGGRIFCIRKTGKALGEALDNLDAAFQGITMNGLYRFRKLKHPFDL